MMLQKPHLTVPSLRAAEAAGRTLDVDVDQQLLGDSPSGHSHPHVALSDDPLPNVFLPVARPDHSVGEKCTSSHVTEEVMIVAYGVGSSSCLVCYRCSHLCIPGVKYYTRCDIFGSLRVVFIHSIVGHSPCSVFATPVCETLPYDGVEAQ
jgi:hypothetical protein